MTDTPGLFALLVVCAGFTSLITAALGAGGGVMLLAIMAQVIPPQFIIPVHGVVQLGSNAGRAAMSWRHIDWSIMAAFVPGAIVGALIGSLVVVILPPAVIYLSISVFTLFLCWGPKLPGVALGRIGTAMVGLVTNFLTLFVGATGPLVGAFLKQIHAARFTTVATFAATMSVQHILKAVVFQVAGFNLVPWLWLIASMIAAGAVGTWIGLKLLRRVSDLHFQLLFRIVLSALALRLLWQAYGSIY